MKRIKKGLALLLIATLMLTFTACDSGTPMPKATADKLTIVNRGETAVTSVQIAQGSDALGLNLLEKELKTDGYTAVKLLGGKNPDKEVKLQVLVTLSDGKTLELKDAQLMKSSYLVINGDGLSVK